MMPYKNLPESEWDKMDRCVEKIQAGKEGYDKPTAIAICYTSISGKEYEPAIEVESIGAQYRIFDANTGATIKQVDSAHEAATEAVKLKATADVNNLPDSAFLHVEAGGEKDDTGKTVPRTLRHLPYKTADGKIDLPTLRNALSRLGQSDTGTAGGDKWLTADLRKSLIAKAQKILADNTDAESAKPEKKEAQPSIMDRILGFLRGDTQTDKEGKRNSSPDMDRLQKIHDLSVENGAECPMVFKQADGKYRWITLSTNAYQDRDGEIVSQKAQDDDVGRMNGDRHFGPLRLWHLGYPDVTNKEAGPGLDIGDCDFSQMFDRIRVESGTFRDERTAAAIKGRADQWATSIGFFHPTDQPDQAGVYTQMHTFERSLLPRGKASNYLTPLAAIVKENNMTTKDEKVRQLTELLGGDAALTDAVLKQVDATEKSAQERGLKFKAAAEPKKGAEGSPEEEKTEPKAEAAAEGDKPDYEAMAKGLAPHIGRMIEEKMRAMKEEQTTKEVGVKTALDQIAAQLKETRAIVDQLNGDLPRGVRDAYRASKDAATVTTDPKYKDNTPEQNPLGQIFNWVTSPMPMYQPPATPPTPSEK